MQRPVAFTSVLAATMAASTFMLLVFGVFADELIADFGVERWQVGLLVTIASGVSALISPAVGGRTDDVGARRSTVLTLGLASIGLALIALAPTYLLLLVAAAVTGLGQAMANPATNKLIAEHVERGRRGVVTGIKQSGVQVGVFVGGATLALLADLGDWRGAVLVFAAVFLGATLAAQLTLPRDPIAHGPAPADEPSPVTAVTGPAAPGTGRLPPLVKRVAVYGFLLGAGGSMIFTFLPLYAEEVLGVSDRAAGNAVALTGLVGIAARIGWGRAAEVRLGTLLPLRLIAVLAAVAAGLLLASGGAGPVALLWPAAAVTGLSASAWNSVGMLAIIQALPSSETGRASGLVMMGFLSGLALAPPAFGWSVDVTGSYVPGWWTAAALFTLSLVVLHGVHEPLRPGRAAAPAASPAS